MPVTVTDSNGQVQTFATENEVQGNISLAQQELERQINFARREFESQRGSGPDRIRNLAQLVQLKQRIASQLPAVVVGFDPNPPQTPGGPLIVGIGDIGTFAASDTWPVAGNSTVAPNPPTTTPAPPPGPVAPAPAPPGPPNIVNDETVQIPSGGSGIPESLPNPSTSPGTGTGPSGTPPSSSTTTPSDAGPSPSNTTPEGAASGQPGGSGQVEVDEDGAVIDEPGSSGGNGAANGAAGGSGNGASTGAPQPATGQGGGATRFDTGIGTKEITINPQGNELDDFASYTYQIALYVMDIQTYVAMLKKPKSASSMPKTLVMRTGGIGSDNDRFSHPFDVDFFIDDLKFTTLGAAPAQATANTSVVNISFQVTEPRGVTLLERLRDLAKKMLPPGESYMNVPYLLEIKFTGYTENGTPVPKIVAPKYIPIKITDFSFNVTESGAIYTVKGVPFNHSVFQQVQATIPADIQIKAGTLSDIFENQADSKKARSDGRTSDSRIPAGSKNEKVSLSQAINKHESNKTKSTKRTPKPEGDAKKQSTQTELVPPMAEKADKIRFVLDKDIANAKLTIGQDPKSNATKVDPKTGKFKNFVDSHRGNVKLDKKTGLVRINAGTNIVKLVNSLIVSSSYIDDNIIESAEAAQKTGKPIKWFQVVPRIEKSLGWDKKAGRYKFEYVYDILPRPMFYSDFPFVDKSMPNGKGIHKIYDYIFTGENTQVLNFRLRFNVAYVQTMSQGSGNVADKDPANALNPGVKELTRSKEGSLQAGQSVKKVRANDLFSNIMNDGTDLVTADIDIVGDPAYLPTGDFFMDKQYGDNPSIYLDPFYPDGTINMVLSPPYVQVNLKTPTDYNDLTGLMDPSQAGRYKSSEFNGVYRVLDIESTFSGGVFSQRLSVMRAPLQPVVKGGQRTLARDPSVASFIERGIQSLDVLSKLSPQLTNKLKEFAPSAIAKIGGDLSQVQQRLEQGLTELPLEALSKRIQREGTAIEQSLRRGLTDFQQRQPPASGQSTNPADEFIDV
jgi:hypothetical protein